LRKSSLIVWLAVIAVLAACEPATAPRKTDAPTSTSSSAPGETFTWPNELESSPNLSFPSAAEAVAFLSEHMDGAVALPTSLPSNVRVDVGASVSVATVDGVRSAQVKLATEQGDVWGIMYGRSGLDGCDTGDARSVTVSGQPGLLSVTADPEGSSRKWVQLVWPATLRDDEGVYGLFGWLPPRAVVAMAESMPVVAAAAVVATAGC
jgi:hypothetical protein